MTLIPSPPANSRDPDRPLWSEPGLAIWARKPLPLGAPDLSLKLENAFGSPFFRGASREKPLYLGAYSALAYGPKLSAREIAHLVRGDEAQVIFRNRVADQPNYPAYLAVSEVQTIPWKNDPTKLNRILRLGRAFALGKKEDGQATAWGWLVDQIIFPRRIKHGTDYFDFSARHAFQCLKLGGCQVQTYEIVYAGAVKKADQTHASAKLHVSVSRDLRISPETTLPSRLLSPNYE